LKAESAIVTPIPPSYKAETQNLARGDRNSWDRVWKSTGRQNGRRTPWRVKSYDQNRFKLIPSEIGSISFFLSRHHQIGRESNHSHEFWKGLLVPPQNSGRMVPNG
jgi:hypothetical protein